MVNFTTKYSFEAGATANTTTTRIKEIDDNSKKIAYTYDPNGNIKTITEGNNQIIYYYDALNQLIQEDNQVLNKTVIYSYDAGGNLTQKLDIIYGTTDRIYTNYKYEDSNWKDKLTEYNGKPITYDNYTFTWEQGRHKQRTQIYDLV